LKTAGTNQEPNLLLAERRDCFSVFLGVVAKWSLFAMALDCFFEESLEACFGPFVCIGLEVVPNSYKHRIRDVRALLI